MPQKQKTAKQEAKPKKEEKAEGNGKFIVIGVIVVIVAVAAALGYFLARGGMGTGGTESFSSFQGRFYSAPRVGIYVTYLNGSTFAYADGCATNLIEEITASRTHHRNMSTIDYMIISNSTSCLEPNGSLGNSNGTKVVPLSNCLAVSANEPSVFINYTMTNSTAIKSGNLYTSGDALFLSECGISSELG